MNFEYHLIFSLSLNLLINKFYLKYNNHNLILLILISSFFCLLPDIDIKTSKFGKKTKIISFFFKHRGFFHSILFGVILTFLLWNTFYFLELVYRELIIYSFQIGYFSHIFLDIFSEKGVELFFPINWKISGYVPAIFLKFIVFILLLISMFVYLV